jgi:hypothetical protein
LSDAEFQTLMDYQRLLGQDPNAEPNAAQKETLDLYQRRYLQFKTTGALVVNGWPIEYFLDEY